MLRHEPGDDSPPEGGTAVGISLDPDFLFSGCYTATPQTAEQTSGQLRENQRRLRKLSLDEIFGGSGQPNASTESASVARGFDQRHPSVPVHDSSILNVGGADQGARTTIKSGKSNEVPY